MPESSWGYLGEEIFLNSARVLGVPNCRYSLLVFGPNFPTGRPNRRRLGQRVNSRACHWGRNLFLGRMACLAGISNRVAVSGQSHRREPMGSGLEGVQPADKALVLNRCMGGSVLRSNSMPSLVEIAKCVVLLPWLFFRCLLSRVEDQERTLSGSPQPYWRQKKKAVQTPGPWWTRSLLPWALLPVTLGALPSTTMSSERPAFRTECRERVGLRHGYQEKESQSKRQSVVTSSEFILANSAGSGTPGS